MRPLGQDAGLRSFACCGLAPLPGGPARIERVVKGEGARGRVSGVVRCGSPWVCPVCGPREAAKRTEGLAPQLRGLAEKGWSCWLMTLTLRHRADNALGGELSAVSGAWPRVTRGRWWTDYKAKGAEFVRGVDLTLGTNGWHVHLHVVLLLGPEHGDGEEAANALVARWRGSLRAIGREALPQGQDVQRANDPVAAAAYATAIAGVSKDSDSVLDGQRAGLFRTVAEAVSAASKRGRSEGGQTAGDLRDAALAGDPQARRQWIIYATATKGRRAVTVSQGLKLEVEPTTAGEGGEVPEVVAPEVVAVMDKLGLRRIDPFLPELLAAVEKGAHEGRMVLRRRLGNPGDLWEVPFTSSFATPPPSEPSVATRPGLGHPRPDDWRHASTLV